VNAFADAVGCLTQVPVVDAAITFDCPYSHKSWLLIARSFFFFNIINNLSICLSVVAAFCIFESFKKE
jgi:hypothetical protein